MFKKIWKILFPKYEYKRTDVMVRDLDGQWVIPMPTDGVYEIVGVEVDIFTGAAIAILRREVD